MLLKWQLLKPPRLQENINSLSHIAMYVNKNIHISMYINKNILIKTYNYNTRRLVWYRQPNNSARSFLVCTSPVPFAVKAARWRQYHHQIYDNYYETTKKNYILWCRHGMRRHANGPHRTPTNPTRQCWPTTKSPLTTTNKQRKNFSATLWDCERRLQRHLHTVIKYYQADMSLLKLIVWTTVRSHHLWIVSFGTIFRRLIYRTISISK